MDGTTQKVTVNFLKYSRGRDGRFIQNASGSKKTHFEKCLVVEMHSEKVRAIEACRLYPAAVKALVQDLLDEHGCDHAEIAIPTYGKTQLIRTKETY